MREGLMRSFESCNIAWKVSSTFRDFVVIDFISHRRRFVFVFTVSRLLFHSLSKSLSFYLHSIAVFPPFFSLLAVAPALELSKWNDILRKNKFSVVVVAAFAFDVLEERAHTTQILRWKRKSGMRKAAKSKAFCGGWVFLCLLRRQTPTTVDSVSCVEMEKKLKTSRRRVWDASFLLVINNMEKWNFLIKRALTV